MQQKHLLYKVILLFFGWMYLVNAQEIRTIQLKPIGSQEQLSIVSLGTTLELSFDDLEADNKEYQYKIEHMTADWKLSNISSGEYINGFQQNYITNISNSFNTLQDYTHYSVNIPNQDVKITKSGNYLISVLNENDKVIFSRKCIFYEPKTTVGVSVFRSRDTKTLNQQQTVQFLIDYRNFNINNPSQEIKVVLFQNNDWNTKITGLQPLFFKPNQLVYSYINGSNFWGGNEFRNFDNKNIRNSNLNISRTEQNEIWHAYLYTNQPRNNKPYYYNPDINGQFVVRSLDANNSEDEADYATIHFSLESFHPYKNKDVYVYGGFNNFELSEQNKMTYNSESHKYSASITLKQGFYNYSYVTVDKNKKLNLYEIDGSFYQTENQYTVIVYYRPFGELYDRVIGVGKGFFNQNK